MVARDIKDGYIKDDGAKDVGADELLQNPEDGTVCGRIAVEITSRMGEKCGFGDELDQRS